MCRLRITSCFSFRLSLQTLLYMLMFITFLMLMGYLYRYDYAPYLSNGKTFNYLFFMNKDNLSNETRHVDDQSSRELSWNISNLAENGTKNTCPPISPHLRGSNIDVIQSLIKHIPSWSQIEKKHLELEPGGRHSPANCISRHKVAIIIPYRNRDSHLRAFTSYMHGFLQRQQLDYGIYVVEQMGNNSFNRAMLMNIGFKEALKQRDFTCFIFHDVDLLPEIDQNLYTCSEDGVRHFSASIDKHGYKLPYENIFGGVGGLSLMQMNAINGFSNEFWGWGGEDDDVFNRVHGHGYRLLRYRQSIARYTMLTHKTEVPSPQRFKYLYSGFKRFKTDGLNSLKYQRVDLKLKKLYTLVQVKIKKVKK